MAASREGKVIFQVHQLVIGVRVSSIELDFGFYRFVVVFLIKVSTVNSLRPLEAVILVTQQLQKLVLDCTCAIGILGSRASSLCGVAILSGVSSSQQVRVG